MSLRSRADSERSEGARGRRAAVSERCERRRHPAERQRSRYVPWGTAAEQRGGDGIPPSKRKTAEDWQSQILQFERRGRDSNPRDSLTRLPHFECGAIDHSATSPCAKVGKISILSKTGTYLMDWGTCILR